jgi:hypothetical protein
MIEVVNSESNSAIVTLALGEKHLADWERHSKPSLIKYCQLHNINLYVQTDSLDLTNRYAKATWQKMLLAKEIQSKFPNIARYCYVDTDIIANPYAKNIFDEYQENKISLVSQFNKLPFDIDQIQKKISFYRHNYYDKNYPLDSAIFMKPKQIYEHHNLMPQPDYACAGLFMSGIKYSADLLSEIFYKYSKETETLTGGDEPIFNYELQKTFEINWIPYKYQAIWNFEMADKLTFLYNRELHNQKLVNFSLMTVLSNYVFLHFAGSWYEKDIWKSNTLFSENHLLEEMQKIQDYMESKVTGHPAGIIKPQNE